MLRENIALAPLTYYKIGGPARYLAQPESVVDLEKVARLIYKEKLGLFVLGAGSNVLFDDQGFDGLVLHTAKLDLTLKQTALAEIEAGASVMNIQLLRLCMSQGIAGFEFLAGVPGNVGGALYMNAGTGLGEASAVLERVDVFSLATGKLRTIEKDALKYSYRAQHFLKPGDVIVRGKMRGRVTEPKVVQDHIQQLLEKRRNSQPIDKPSCGSVFKNPDAAKGIFAGKLIEELGLKGLKRGGAQISPMHANFFVNLGGASSEDVKALIAEAKAKVLERYGVELHEEVRIVPFKPEVYL